MSPPKPSPGPVVSRRWSFRLAPSAGPLDAGGKGQLGGDFLAPAAGHEGRLQGFQNAAETIYLYIYMDIDIEYILYIMYCVYIYIYYTYIFIFIYYITYRYPEDD